MNLVDSNKKDIYIYIYEKKQLRKKEKDLKGLKWKVHEKLVQHKHYRIGLRI